MQAYAYTKYLGHLNLTFDDNGELLEFQGQPILLDGSKRQGICKNISINMSSLRKRGSASNPKIEYQVFSCIFHESLAMATLGLKEMGKFLWKGKVGIGQLSLIICVNA